MNIDTELNQNSTRETVKKEELSKILKIAALYQKIGKTVNAIEIYLSCIEQFPNDFRAFFNLGSFLFRTVNLDSIS
jgi:hypothetical protein